MLRSIAKRCVSNHDGRDIAIKHPDTATLFGEVACGSASAVSFEARPTALGSHLTMTGTECRLLNVPR